MSKTNHTYVIGIRTTRVHINLDFTITLKDMKNTLDLRLNLFVYILIEFR